VDNMNVYTPSRGVVDVAVDVIFAENIQAFFKAIKLSKIVVNSMPDCFSIGTNIGQKIYLLEKNRD